MPLIHLFILICLVVPINYIGAQTDSFKYSLEVDTILLQSSRWQEAQKTHHSQQLDKNSLRPYNSRSLSDILSLESSFFVKNYGIGNSSTLSGRGGSAAQTTVLWEGFDIQNPMLGQVDLSLISGSFVDYATIQYGGEAALFGNSAVGGAIHIGSKHQFGKGWQFGGQMQAGSFESFGQQAQLIYSNKIYSVSLRTNYQAAKNNFPYIDINAFGQQKPILLQQNAATEQFGILNEHHFKIKNQRLGLKIWYQQADRQLPPTLLNSQSTDRQIDISLRSVLLWSMVHDKMIWKARTAFFVESLRFQNQLIDDYSLVFSSITEAENKWYIHQQHQLLTGINCRFSTAISDGYQSTREQLRAAIFAAYQFQTKNRFFESHLRIRSEIVNTQLIRPAASAGFIWRFYKELKAKVQLSNNYRLPTFNDLYWKVLGNPNLKPEYSWNTEFSVQLPWSFKKIRLETSMSCFSNWVDDWILWTPNATGLWRPENIDRVWARGIEADLDLVYKSGPWLTGIQLNYAFTKSTRIAGKKPETLGKQLIYVPEHQGNLKVYLQYKSTRITYQHQMVSARYTDNLNLEKLPLYQLAHLQIDHSFLLNTSSAAAFVRIANLFGTNYQIIQMRPMPWQQFELGIRLDINH